MLNNGLDRLKGTAQSSSVSATSVTRSHLESYALQQQIPGDKMSHDEPNAMRVGTIGSIGSCIHDGQGYVGRKSQ